MLLLVGIAADTIIRRASSREISRPLLYKAHNKTPRVRRTKAKKGFSALSVSALSSNSKPSSEREAAPLLFLALSQVAIVSTPRLLFSPLIFPCAQGNGGISRALRTLMHPRSTGFHLLPPLVSTSLSLPATPISKKRAQMWRSVAKRAPCFMPRLVSPLEPILNSEARTLPPLLCAKDQLTHFQNSWLASRTQLTQFHPNSYNLRAFATVAEAEVDAASSTDAEEETSTSIHEMKNSKAAAEVRTPLLMNGKLEPPMNNGMTVAKFTALRKRQIKIETEAWEQAAKEYRELLTDMCQQKLAPNLPYVKSLLLGWFEPLKDKILEQQDWCQDSRNRASYTDYFLCLPADMMAVITMHKMMSLLMMGNQDGMGTIRVVQAAMCIGEAIEQEVRDWKLYSYLNCVR